MKILVVSERLPSPLGGGASRQYNLIRQLAPRHQYTLVAFAFPEDLAYQTELKSFVERLEILPMELILPKKHSRIYWQWDAWKHAIFEMRPKRGLNPLTAKMHLLVENLLRREDFDLIQVHQAYMEPALPAASTPILLDMHDILSDYEQDQINQKSKISHRFQSWLEWRKMLYLETRISKRARVVTTVSEQDQRRLSQLISGLRLVVVPNGVDTSYFQPISEPSDESMDLVFVGSMNYRPNADAVRWFNQHVFPLVQARCPAVSWHIVGWGPPADIQALHNPPAIVVTGQVEDVRPYLAKSALVVVPLQGGAGTRLKILDAWAMSKAVISTTIGAAGLPAIHAHNLILADEPRDFVEHIITLLANPELRILLGKEGRRTVEPDYTWSAISQKMEIAYQLAIS